MTKHESITGEELGLKLLVDIENGHKTGFYLDQRDNRAIASDYCQGARVLNCFSYTGGFGLAALRGGAREVIGVFAVGLNFQRLLPVAACSPCAQGKGA